MLPGIDLNTIGSRLKFVRNSKRLTQKEIALELGVSHSMYQKYEGNACAISIEKLTALYTKFDISPLFILTGKNISENKTEALQTINQNTITRTKIEEGCLVITSKIPLFDHVG
jgi:transcriptional regulator with XRE-family HTH domain